MAYTQEELKAMEGVPLPPVGGPLFVPPGSRDPLQAYTEEELSMLEGVPPPEVGPDEEPSDAQFVPLPKGGFVGKDYMFVPIKPPTMVEKAGLAIGAVVPDAVEKFMGLGAEKVVDVVSPVVAPVWDWANAPVGFVTKIREEADKALMEAPPGTGTANLAAVDLFAKSVLEQMANPINIAGFGLSGAAAKATTLAQAGKVSSGTARTIHGVGAAVNAAGTAPAIQATNEAIAAAIENPTPGTVGAAVGAGLLTALGTAATALDVKGAATPIKPRAARTTVVSDADWNQIKDNVRSVMSEAETTGMAQTLSEMELGVRRPLELPGAVAEAPAPRAPLPLPEAPVQPKGAAVEMPVPRAPLPLPEAPVLPEGTIRTDIPSGETIPLRAPELPIEAERRMAKAGEFNARVKRITNTFLEDGIQLKRWHAVELAKVTDPREYSLYRQTLLDIHTPRDPGAPAAPRQGLLKGFGELTPEMVGIQPAPEAAPVAPSKPKRRTLRAPKPEPTIYDSGLVDGQDNPILVNNEGIPVKLPKRKRTAVENEVHQKQLADDVQREKDIAAAEKTDQIKPDEAVIVSSPELPAPIPAKFVRKTRNGKSAVATQVGTVEVPNTTIVTEAEAAAKANPQKPIITKVKDSTIGGWDVQIGPNQYRIFRDPEDRWWYLDAVGHHSRRVLSTETKAAAIENLVTNEQNWIALIKAEEDTIKRIRLQLIRKVAQDRGIIPKTTEAKAPEIPASVAAEVTPMPGLDTEASLIEVALSAVPSTAKQSNIPGLAKLHKVSQTDPSAARLLSDIAADSITYLVQDIPSVKLIHYPAKGLYGGSLEGSIRLSLSFNAADRDTVMSALSRFAQNFFQEQIHVRGMADAGTKPGHKYPDGSSNTVVYSWKTKGMSRPDIEKLAKKSGLSGFTATENELLAYYTDDPSNAKAIERFKASGAKVSESLGRSVPRVERLWIYGEGGIPYPKVTGELPIAGTKFNHTARRIAARLAAREVQPVPQAAKLTAPQTKLQTKIADAYGRMRMNALKDDWKVDRSYSELADELMEQYEALPVKVEILSGKGEPYKNSMEMRSDVLGNNHLFIFGTDADTFGPKGVDYTDHPLLQDSGLKDINDKPLLFNDLLRAVHDYYAHTMSPVQFGVLGEEAAWRNHMAMTRSPWARWALSSETRGQNSYVNFGPDGARNRANPKDTKFAPQKTDLLPIEYAKTGDPLLDKQMDDIDKMPKPEYVREKGRRSMSKARRGAINLQLLHQFGQTALGGGIGFVYGYNKDPDASLADRVSLGMQFAVFGMAFGNPFLRNAVLNGIVNAKLPVRRLGMSKYFEVSDNWIVFPQSVIGKVYDVIKGQAPLAESYKDGAMRALKELELMRGKVATTDWHAAMDSLANRGDFDLILDEKLRVSAMKARQTVDDFTEQLIAAGLVEPGSDLEATMLRNQGKYLYRTYEVFTNPDFQYDPVLRDRAVAEYVKQQQLDKSTKTLDQLWQEGIELTLYQIAKAKGTTAMAPNARSFATGQGIARPDGSVLKPRKELSDAWRDMLGEITDPVRAGILTVDRMGNLLAAAKTRQKMADIGKQIGIFTPNATSTHTVPLTTPDGLGIYPGLDSTALSAYPGMTPKGADPLAKLWTTPEAADGLRTMAAYQSHSAPYRWLATVTGNMKLAKTVFHPVTYAPNFLSSLTQPIVQGHAVQMVMNPKIHRDAISVVFNTPFPSNVAKIERDIPVLIREGILRQGVNTQDMLETARASGATSLGNRIVTWLPPKAGKVVKGVAEGALSVYGKLEEFPRVISFYAEVGRYAKVLFGKSMDNLTPQEEAVVYQRAIAVTKEVYPNSQNVPEVVKKFSTLGVLEPFVAFKYETFRTFYTTMRRAVTEFQEAQQTGNKRFITSATVRLTSLIGTAYALYALNEAMNETKGVSGEQDKALRRRLPEWDRTGLLIVTDFDKDQVAYANQSYLFPQSTPVAAIKAALEGKTPVEAASAFMAETAGSMVSDGGLFFKPLAELVSGYNEYGRKIFPSEGGKFVDVSGIESAQVRNNATVGQNFVIGAAHLMKNLNPGSITEGMRWYKAAREEVGPDGQIYQVGDLANRLIGVRVQRIDLPLQFERQAGALFGRLNSIQTEFGRARNRKDATPDSIEQAYQMSEQGRKIIFRDLVEYLRDGEVLLQPKEKILANLRESGISSDFLLGALNGVYIPGKKEKAISARTTFEALMSMPQAERDRTWAQLIATDPTTAKSLIPMMKEAAMGRTEEERMLLSVNSSDGSRARMIAMISLSQPDPTLQNLKYRELVSRGMARGETSQWLFGDPTKATRIWAEARSLTAKGQMPEYLPVPEANSTPPTNPGASMRPPAGFVPINPPPPPPTPGQKTSFKEGRLYKDPTTGTIRMYRNGQFV